MRGLQQLAEFLRILLHGHDAVRIVEQVRACSRWARIVLPATTTPARSSMVSGSGWKHMIPLVLSSTTSWAKAELKCLVSRDGVKIWIWRSRACPNRRS